MFRNYLAAALRNLVRNKLYAAINIVGLAVGFAAALLIALYVRDELSYDRWIPGYDRLYLVYETIAFPGHAASPLNRSFVTAGPLLKLDFPEIDAVTRIAPESDPVRVRTGNLESFERVYWADPNLLSILRLPVLFGAGSDALATPGGVVITDRIARRYFGRDNAVGEPIEIGGRLMAITGVLKDLPSNTQLDTEIILSGRSSNSLLAQMEENSASGVGTPIVPEVYTYLRLKPAASAVAVERGLPAFLDRHLGQQLAGNPMRLSLQLTPLAAIHLRSGAGRPGTGDALTMKPSGNPAVIKMMAIVALLILVIAAMNFINLMTARAAQRAIEVGVRKVSGAARRALVVQFIGEALIYVGCALTIAAVSARMLRPAFNSFLQRDVASVHWHDFGFAAGVVAFTVLVGVIAGAYPAFVLSAFNPAAVFKAGNGRSSASAVVRQALVVIQFALLIGFIVGAIVMGRQLHYAANEGLRVDTDQVLVIRTGCAAAFRDRVAELPGVQRAACSANIGLGASSPYGTLGLPNGISLTGGIMSVDAGFFDLYGLRPIAGRLFTDREGDAIPPDANPYTTPPPAVVINETAVRSFGFASPEAALGHGVKLPATSASAPIIGVVPDFSLESVTKPILPTVYRVAPLFQILSVRLAGRDIPDTLAAIDQVWSKLGEDRPIDRAFVDQRVQAMYADVTRQQQLFEVSSALAIFIACLGLLGLAAFTAERRTKEIGIRKAMGATRADILRLILWEFAKPVLWANVIAWPVGYIVMHRWLQGFAYHVNLSPWVFLAASALALMIAVLTVAGHALLIARSQPATALRYE